MSRVVGAWNVLPGVVVKAYTTVEFRRLLDRHMDMQGIDHVQADELILASCLAQTLWAEGPVAVLSYGLYQPTGSLVFVWKLPLSPEHVATVIQ